MADDADRWPRVSALFEEALSRDPTAREAYVECAAGGNVDLLREVRSLLAAHDNAGGFLEQPAAQLSADLLGETISHWRDGEMAGPYRVIRQIGLGGMGVVYLAEDTRLGRQTALKVLDPRHVSDPKRRERLRKEAQAAARLHHPNIATVYALEDIDGHLCIAAEYVAGRTLRNIIDDGVPDAKTVVRIATETARALEAAHDARIVHRDLKPENVMVDERGVVRLLDFGVAVTDDEPAASRLTDPGIVVGTPGYMAPEQIEGRTVDVRTDQFLFGILVFELATGVHPFRGATRASTDARILTAEPARISGLGEGPLGGLDRIVRTCLQKKPAGRFPTTHELVHALDTILQQVRGSASAGAVAHVSAAPASRSVSAIAWWRWHQLAVSVSISGMLVGSWWLAQWIGRPFRYPLFFGLLALGVTIVTLRIHLLFAERQTPGGFSRLLWQVGGWLKQFSVVFGVVCGLAALAVSEAHPAAAGFALAAAAILTIAALIIEPATTEEAIEDSRR